MMNVGICIRHDNNVAAHIQDAAQKGFAHAQLISWQPSLWTDEQAQAIQAALDKHGDHHGVLVRLVGLRYGTLCRALKRWG